MVAWFEIVVIASFEDVVIELETVAWFELQVVREGSLR